MNIHAAGDKMRRREEILQIVRATAVHSQDELMTALHKRGFAVTQPTLSRDLRELGLLKTPNGYVSPDTLAPVATFVPRETAASRFEHLIRDTLLFAEAAVNLVILKTPPAAAQPLASAIDAMSIDNLLGNVAGDDTIFVAFRTPATAAIFTRRVLEIAGLRPAPRRRRA